MSDALSDIRKADRNKPRYSQIEYDAAIEQAREDEREMVLNAIRDACAARMSDKNPKISGVMLSYILADLRHPVTPAPAKEHDQK